MRRHFILFIVVCSMLFVSACGEKSNTYVENQTMTLKFEFGERSGSYTGEVIEDIPNGFGTFCSETDDGIEWTYYGEWENGHFSGYGITEWGNGQVQAGEYKNDQYNGWELWIESNGEVFAGRYENGEVVEALVQYDTEEEQQEASNDIFSENYTRAAVWAEASFGEEVVYSELGEIGEKAGSNFQIVIPNSYEVEEADIAWQEIKDSVTMLMISGLEYDTISISYYSPQNEVVLNALLTLNSSGEYELSSISGDLTKSNIISSKLTD